MDSISQARLQLIYPALAATVTAMIATLERENVKVRVTQALRSWSEQDALYAQGRDANGEPLPGGHVVTNCRGGYSYHNFGLAVDLVPSLYGPGEPYAPNWNKAHPSWVRMIQLGQSLGLDSGATWRSFPDAPHFQLTGRFPEGAPSDEVRQLFRDGGTQAVWDEVARS